MYSINMRILIYGYGENLGKALMEEFTKAGHHVVAVGNQSSNTINNHFEFINRSNFNPNTIGRIDAIIFNGSYFEKAHPLTVSKMQIEKSLKRHLFDLVELQPIILEMEKKCKGVILVTSNILATKAGVASCLLSLGKSILESYTASIAKALEGSGVEVKIIRVLSKITGNRSEHTEGLASIYHLLLDYEEGISRKELVVEIP